MQCLKLGWQLLAAFEALWSSRFNDINWARLSTGGWDSAKLRSGRSVQCLLLTFALTKKLCSMRIAQKTIIMLLWCAGCCWTGFLSLYSSWCYFFFFSEGCKGRGANFTWILWDLSNWPCFSRLLRFIAQTLLKALKRFAMHFGVRGAVGTERLAFSSKWLP